MLHIFIVRLTPLQTDRRIDQKKYVTLIFYPHMSPWYKKIEGICNDYLYLIKK
jgi:hypothetical protein